MHVELVIFPRTSNFERINSFRKIKGTKTPLNRVNASSSLHHCRYGMPLLFSQQLFPDFIIGNQNGQYTTPEAVPHVMHY